MLPLPGRSRSGPWGGPVAGRPRRRHRPSRRTYLAPTHPAVIEKGSPRFTPARRPRSPMFRRRLRTRRQSGREHRTRPPGARGRHSRPPEPAHRRAGGTFRPTRAGHAGTLYANWLLEPRSRAAGAGRSRRAGRAGGLPVGVARPGAAAPDWRRSARRRPARAAGTALDAGRRPGDVGGRLPRVAGDDVGPAAGPAGDATAPGRGARQRVL